MFLAAYVFPGDPEELLVAYRRFVASLPPDALTLHVCACRHDGLFVIDACPSEATFRAFSGGEGFRTMVDAAGLPWPTVEPLGDVRELRTPDAP